ncbi:thioredoxin family protein [Labilithrix luteola]|uniref:Thioredoxin family protein n=1 Tax=Labilithrix luteola TaxID=1391654 RepID=A0A0K1PV00_9BACT|nr:TlpA disulfide reductase family protein [Labilithrix luteola]AKU97201.1 thioredoxin family protein [Labilithrix luteola]
MRVGDRIVALDGNKVTDPAEVSRLVASRRAGESISVSLARGGRPVTAAVTLARRPSGDDILRMDLVGAFAPAWTNVTPLSGAPASLDKLRGQVVLVDFWATWCGPCRMLAPKLSALKDRYGAQGLNVVGITTDPAEKAAVFAERNQMRYGVVVDKEGDTSRAYGISSLPTMLLIDKRGVVREVMVGFDPGGDARLESLIKSLLAEPASQAAAAGR